MSTHLPREENRTGTGHERELVRCTDCGRWHNARKTNQGEFLVRQGPKCVCGSGDFRMLRETDAEASELS